MGQKVNANGFRIGMTRTWPSIWFADGEKFRDQFLADTRIRRKLLKKFKECGVSSVNIERSKKTSITINSSKPGVIIGKQGAQIEELRKELEKEFGGSFEINVHEVRNPESDAECVAEAIQGQIERRMPYRRACKMAMEKAMSSGALGIKISISGRLNGAEIARSDSFKDGNVPLQTLRANITQATKHSVTTYGTIGVQVWIYKGMVFKKLRDARSPAITSLSQVG